MNLLINFLWAVGALSAVTVSSAVNLLDSEKSVTFSTSEFARGNCAFRESKDVLMTVVLLYHNECESLKFATTEWIGLPKDITENVRFLVIDNYSRFPASSCVGKDAPVAIARVESDLLWNIGGARNLGAFLACSDFLFIADIDAYMSKNVLHAAINHVQTNAYAKSTIFQHNRYMGSGFKVHPGIMIINRDWYWKIHGCDEDFVGHYGSTDPHLRYRSSAANGTSVHLQNEYLCHVVSSVDEAKSKELPAQDRAIEINAALFMKKRTGQVAWNHTILRFDWRMVKERAEPTARVPGSAVIKLNWKDDDSASASDPKELLKC